MQSHFLQLIVLLAIFSILLLVSLAFCSTVLLAFFNTLICLIFIKRNLKIFLTIFFIPIFFLLWNYTINIDGNFCNIFEMYSDLFWIHCTSLQLFGSHNMIFNYFMVIFLILHKLFHPNDWFRCCYARVLICWTT